MQSNERANRDSPPLTRHGYPDWKKVLEPFGFKPPSRAMWLRAHHVRYLYFIQTDDLVKIGISGDPKQRIDDLSAGFPGRTLKIRRTVELPAILAFQTERRVHDKLKEFSVGREWFRMDPIEAKAAAVPICQLAHRAATELDRKGFWYHYERPFEAPSSLDAA